MGYTFGDTSLAGERLELLARAHEPSSARLLERARDDFELRPRLVFDAGCARGHTTRLLHRVFRCRVTGLDASLDFVRQARELSEPGVEFHLHDVTTGPFPNAPGDLVYSRFLLTHLDNPTAALALWREQLVAGGAFLLEETERLETSHPVLARYYSILGALQRAHGQTMEMGPRLGPAAAGAGLRVLDSRVVLAPADGQTMARLHSMNIRTWKANAFVQETYPAGEISELESALSDLAAARVPAPDLRYEIRQMIAAC